MGNTPATRMQLRDRRARAREMFTQGHNDENVKDELSISLATVRRYRVQYETEIADEARNNPQLLNKVLENTVRSLHELDLIRTKAWDRYDLALTDSARNSFLATALRAQSERAKLFGLMGVKQEYFQHVQKVQMVSQKILDFLQKELCPEDRLKLETYLTVELREFMSDDVTMLETETIAN